MSYRRRIKKHLHNLKIRLRGREKVFIIGANKTGTTSLEAFLKELGYTLVLQSRFERLQDAYRNQDFAPILELCKTAEAFQDVPFSLSTNAFLDELRRTFPKAKFILSVRDNASVWVGSLTRFHRKMFYEGIDDVTWDDVRAVAYNNNGTIKGMLHLHGLTELTSDYAKPPYDPEVLEQWYNEYNDRIRSYFQHSPDFLEVNLKELDAAKRIQEFLGLEVRIKEMPRLNQS